MIKITALNEELSEESDEENIPALTQEAEEQIALTEYNRALVLLKEEQIDEALDVLKDLLETELLDQVEKPDVSDGRTRPMISLKYCCYKNIGAIYSQKEKYNEAIDNYCEAANLDDTDVMLWCRMGKLAIKTSNLEFAGSAFKQGLKCNPNHWPCLDSIITVMFAVPDYMNCLLYISMALERDPSYVKGLAFRDKIYRDIPYFEESYKLFNSDWALDPPINREFDRLLGDKLITEAKDIANKWIEYCKPDFTCKSLLELSLRKPIISYSWLDFGLSLVDMHQFISDNNLNFISKIKLNVNNLDDEKMETDVNQQDIEKDNGILEDVVPEINNLLADSVNITEERKNSVNNDQEVPNVNIDIELMEVDVKKEDGKDDKTDKLSNIQADSENKAFIQNKQVETVDNNQEELEKPCYAVNLDYDDVNNNGDACEKSEASEEKKTEEKSKNDQQKVKKRRRSSLCFLQQWAWSSSSQRRSPRVRGSNRREAEREEVQLEEIMRRIFPNNLLPDTTKIIRDDPLKSIDDSMDTMDLYQLFANRDNNSNNEGTKSSESSKPTSPEINEKYFDTDLEKNDVSDFILRHSGKSNIMIIIARFTEILATKWNIEWPKKLTEIYLQTYLFMREHIPHGSPFSESYKEESILKYDAEMTLLFCELHTDKWLDNKPDTLPSAAIDRFGTGIPSEELGYVLFSSIPDISNEERTLFLLRVLWVKANVFMCQGDADVAIKTLELLLHDMQELFSSKTSIRLPNCKYYSCFNAEIVKKRLASVERGQKLGEVQKLYDEQRYMELSLILQDTFKFTKQRNEIVTVTKLNVDRIQQLSMLLDCFWQLQQYEDCFVWAEMCLNEAWQVYINLSEDAEQIKWSQSVMNTLEKLESCIEATGTMIVKYLPDSKSKRLIQNLIQVLCHQLDVPEGTIEMPIETVIPWIILHHILQYEDDKERAKSKISQKIKSSNVHNSVSDDEDDDKNIPAAIMILFTGHDFLGRHSWCCINEAKLLIFTIKTVIPSICGPRLHGLREKIGKHVEQIFWCLYGHPNRFNKTKPKHLEDHVVPQIPMTWDVAQLLFEFYKPDIYPEFDTAKATAISADTKILFKKISTLVPKEHDPSYLVDDMAAYIVGDMDKPPTVKKPLPYQVDSLYYLLGDYSFKNNVWPSAIKYYTMDIILHPLAFNSWVALAMSVSTVIGTSLNNCKPLLDIMKLLHQAKMAQCSYRRATELKPGHSVIWIEYGNFVYAIHSFCSRLLKQESDTLSMEKFAILETRKEETLDVAANCFNSANSIYLANIDDEPHMQDERWLYQYMLAKISEKKNDEPLIFLGYYKHASDLLHQNNAFYPRRISHKNALYLSIEAIEVHYRIHASILKYLEQHDCKKLKKSMGQLFMKNLMDCASSPFMQFPSKLMKNKKKEDDNGQEKVVNNPSENMSIDIVSNSRTNGEKRQNSVEEVIIYEKSETIKSKKRSRESLLDDSSKRIKLSSVSHLQLMQDVVGLIDDLITKVCENVVNEKEQRDTSSDEVMIISSDESDKERSNQPDNKNDTLGAKIAGNSQDIIDDLMKHANEINDIPLLLPHDNIDNVNVQANDSFTSSKDKSDKKKSQVNAVKNEAASTMSRRGSQESTTTTLTTTTNETNNSSFSSSDESSSSDDSSNSDSSSVETDSDSGDSDTEKKKTLTLEEEKEEYMTDAEVGKIIALSIAGLEQCVLRFPEHYKSIYRICHYYFNSKTLKDNNKCRDLLLGTYKCQYYTGLTFQGLFADRKNTNFFNGVWRIPSEEIDRPGSFASHMSRCVTLLMQILKETDDSKMLMELCIQLRKIPDSDKKYVRDSEREQLSTQALTLCLQSLRTRVSIMGPPSITDNIQQSRLDARTHCLLDVWKAYQLVQKNIQGKEAQAFATLLVDAYKSYMGIKTAEGNLVEVALRFCQQQNAANKNASVNSLQQNSNTLTSIATAVASSSSLTTSTAVAAATAIAVTTVSSEPAIQTQSQSVPTSPKSLNHQRKAYKHSGTGRPRGRPPNINKHLQNPFNTSGAYGNYLGATGNQSLMAPFYMMDPNMLSAVIASGLSGNMMDPLATVNYLARMGNYQDMYRQYSNLSSLSSFGNLPTSLPSVSSISTMSTSATSNSTSSQPIVSVHGSLMTNAGNPTVQHVLNKKKSTSTPTTYNPMTFNQSKPITTISSLSSKELSHSVSITPVTAANSKQKSIHIPVHTDPVSAQFAKVIDAAQPLKSISHSPTQMPLLKSSPATQLPLPQSSTSPLPKQMSATQIRISKTLSEPQPAHNSSFSVSPVKSSGSTGISLPPVGINHQSSSLNIQSVPHGMSQSYGPSLQQKLQFKKQGQPISTSQKTSSSNPAKKQKTSLKNQIPSLPTNIQNLLNMGGAGAIAAAPFVPSELGGLSVSAVNHSINQKGSSKLSSFRKPSKSKTGDLPTSSQNSVLQPSPSEALSMLSQLQQHSHLEIIPQAKTYKSAVDYSTNVPSSSSVLPKKTVDNTRSVVSPHDASRKSNNSQKQIDKHVHDKVEIITLDD
ncbi:hypothetical protein HCN44_004874 [Aphidius gifuensis]|uniref:Calcineurin-binding protein cabin-1 n=1 Tax=Aphidius gifuensis TaxID=684658 RepID=A0A834XUY5_APHGI|nr:calcineurin-binding protein cabin-1-like [Aphidius gifuensis]KAF7992530.1 hypothetical protein HCN44_004874 [Aphidius gifuensis]